LTDAKSIFSVSGKQSNNNEENKMKQGDIVRFKRKMFIQGSFVLVAGDSYGLVKEVDGDDVLIQYKAKTRNGYVPIKRDHRPLMRVNSELCEVVA
jgi:hypothetical protein